MNTNPKFWMLPMAGSLLLAAGSACGQDTPHLERASLDSTNRLTGSLRFGLNITGKFINPGGSFNPHNSAANGHYDNGYVLRDVSGNAGGKTWNWGYDNKNQVNAAASTIDFQRTLAPSLPGESSSDTPSVGAEVTYDYQLGIKEDWHHLRYGVEMAANYMPFSFSESGTYGVATRTDTYAYTHGTTPPGYTDPSTLPYQGSFNGPGFVIGSKPVNSTTVAVPGSTLQVNDNFNANLWGFRLGPYLENPLTENLSLHVSGGLAAGIVNANANWKETYTPAGGGASTVTSGSGSDTQVLWGYYIGADAIYQFNDHWGLDAGVQFQDLGTYSHDFGGRTAQLDLSQSVYLQLGVSYSF